MNLGGSIFGVNQYKDVHNTIKEVIMPTPKTDKPDYQKDQLDRAIDHFAGLEEPSLNDLNGVTAIAQVQAGLNLYRAIARNMTPEELEDETHNSSLLGEFIEAEGHPRPHSLCDAHAIVSGGHTGAARVRAVLAWYQRRIDDPINGCWLPRNTAAINSMPEYLRTAVPHSRIHRKGYYLWLQGIISLTTVSSETELVNALRTVKHKLQTSTFPEYVMLPAHKVDV